jgi:AmiR/NasT family two-component response regulator
MKTPLRVLVAEGERNMREFLHEALARLGYDVVGACLTGQELVEKAKQTEPDIIIADIRLNTLDGIDAVTAINRERAVPVIFLSAHHDHETLSRANANFVVGFLIKPVSEPEIKTAITIGLGRFQHLNSLVKEATELRQALEDRKIVEKAKGIAMKRLRLEEDEAFRRLRKLASNENIKLNEVCRRVLSAEEVFQSLEM